MHRAPEEEIVGSPIKTVDIPIGRVELFGLVLHIVEHDGRLVAACPDAEGMVVAPLSQPDVSSRSCRRLMRSAVDLLLTAAEKALSASPRDAADRGVCKRGQWNCRAACGACIQHGETAHHEAAITTLIDMLAEANVDSQFAAMELAEIGAEAKRALPALLRLRLSNNLAMRCTADHAIRCIVGHDPSSPLTS